MNPESENHMYKMTIQDRSAVGYLMSVLPELSVVDVSELVMVTGEMTIGVSSPSVAVGIGRGTAGVNGDWGSVLVSVGWSTSSAAVIL